MAIIIPLPTNASVLSVPLNMFLLPNACINTLWLYLKLYHNVKGYMSYPLKIL